jgi:tetratricopeptide (TPR) repeat protein
VDHEDHVAYLWKGALLFQSGHEDIGLSDMRRAYELNPNGSLTLATLGFHEAMSGNASKGIEYIERALRLSPRDPLRFLFLGMLGWAHFAVADYEKGVDSAQRSVADSQATAFSHLCLLVNCAGAAKLERAKAELRTLQSIAPEMVEARLAGQWPSTNIEMWGRATHLLRITAGLEQPGAAAA